MEEFFFGNEYQLSRFIIQRALGLIYAIAFLNAINQFRPLLGEKGLLPVKRFTQIAPFKKFPSIFQYHYSDNFFRVIAWAGFLLSLAALSGITDRGPVWISMVSWFLLWAFYQSIVNVGQLFYSFGWESMLLEIGFYAIFLAPAGTAVPVLTIWVIRWMVFRVEFGAGLIKIRGDQCWRDLTCMYYHHETQPMPNPLSWFSHHTPGPFHRIETASNHFVQLIAVWGIFFPQPIASISAILIILTQSYLLLSGNYSWLNLMTIVLAVSGLNDAVLQPIIPLELHTTTPPPLYFQLAVGGLAVLVIYLSIPVIKNLISSFQLMNASFNPLHLVNTYGAFGSVTKKRYEIIIEGTNDNYPGENSEWKAYEFKGKPGNPYRMPPQIAPYHLRLDWQIWFSAMRPFVSEKWFIRMIEKLLKGDKQFLKLLKYNPFPENPPKWIRARRFLYRYSTLQEKRQTGKWWHVSYANEYMQPVNLNTIGENTGFMF